MRPAGSRAYYTGANVAPVASGFRSDCASSVRHSVRTVGMGYLSQQRYQQSWRKYALQGEQNLVGLSHALPRIAGIRLFWN